MRRRQIEEFPTQVSEENTIKKEGISATPLE
jgi:hypothetical protein